MGSLDDLPGFRRRLMIMPAVDRVQSAVEDDYHCMSVTVHHAAGIATRLEPVMERAPWSTCPGAVAQLQSTFTGVPLDAFASRGEKSANCTHLHDLAVLAAAHAFDPAPIVYDIIVSDPVGGRNQAELRLDGNMLLHWAIEGSRLAEPRELAGTELFSLRSWIESLAPDRRESARLLQWGTLIAMGRGIKLEDQSDAGSMPTGACYTFQPSQAARAVRIGAIRDFSSGSGPPLATIPKHGGMAPFR